MQWEILGSLFKSQLRFLEGQERLCREMKADTFRYADKHEVKKIEFLK